MIRCMGRESIRSESKVSSSRNKHRDSVVEGIKETDLLRCLGSPVKDVQWRKHYKKELDFRYNLCTFLTTFNN